MAEPTDQDTDDYLTEWAAGVAATVMPEELTQLVKDYRNQARIKGRSAADREFARRRAKALAEVSQRNS